MHNTQYKVNKMPANWHRLHAGSQFKAFRYLGDLGQAMNPRGLAFCGSLITTRAFSRNVGKLFSVTETLSSFMQEKPLNEYYWSRSQALRKVGVAWE